MKKIPLRLQPTRCAGESGSSQNISCPQNQRTTGIWATIQFQHYAQTLCRQGRIRRVFRTRDKFVTKFAGEPALIISFSSVKPATYPPGGTAPAARFEWPPPAPQDPRCGSRDQHRPCVEGAAFRFIEAAAVPTCTRPTYCAPSPISRVGATCNAVPIMRTSAKSISPYRAWPRGL